MAASEAYDSLSMSERAREFFDSGRFRLAVEEIGEEAAGGLAIAFEGSILEEVGDFGELRELELGDGVGGFFN